jgi:hypothetical protein
VTSAPSYCSDGQKSAILYVFFHVRKPTGMVCKRSTSPLAKKGNFPCLPTPQQMGAAVLRCSWFCERTHEHRDCPCDSPLSPGIASPPLTDQPPSSMGGSGWSRSVQNRLLNFWSSRPTNSPIRTLSLSFPKNSSPQYHCHSSNRHPILPCHLRGTSPLFATQDSVPIAREV